MTRQTAHAFPRAAQGPSRVVVVAGMSAAGNTTALKALDDLGYEAVDNLPQAGGAGVFGAEILTRLLRDEGYYSDPHPALLLKARNSRGYCETRATASTYGIATSTPWPMTEERTQP